MRVQLCDFCGDVIEPNTGAMIKVYDKRKLQNQRNEFMWGTNHDICASCFKDLEIKMQGTK